MYVSIEGQGHFFTIYFPGFVCFCALQDHWSSGFKFYDDYSKVFLCLKI